jgi:acyl transferase domain-containing protein
MIEIQGINTVFQDSHPDAPLILGAGKTCLGHTEAAAGLVGLLKAIASLKHSAVPGLTHLTEKNLNPTLDCKSVPLHIPIETVSLPSRQSGAPHHGVVM